MRLDMKDVVEKRGFFVIAYQQTPHICKPWGLLVILDQQTKQSHLICTSRLRVFLDASLQRWQQDVVDQLVEARNVKTRGGFDEMSQAADSI
jgi:hypothetical protein